jgi:hypothetical protein
MEGDGRLTCVQPLLAAAQDGACSAGTRMAKSIELYAESCSACGKAAGQWGRSGACYPLTGSRDVRRPAYRPQLCTLASSCISPSLQPGTVLRAGFALWQGVGSDCP